MPLEPAEALRLLGTVPLGRIVFTRHALPAIRPVNHLLEGDDIIVRTHKWTALARQVDPGEGPGVVVAYEADAIDPVTHLGWSVVATGYAHLITGQDELEHYGRLLRPWAEQPMDCAVRIRPEEISGLRLVA
ncbi:MULTISPECIES: pyridoxamine 5'-phosphate oxidase family protein [unclassified Streptomyces]|uniref:pyridoxamine 5'-phosphate oxidase family protein n=1 Tax=unclassified Streptomyces TaxID=2593676 RepID=UPI001F04E5B2|nr:MULTISPECIES: pyridoxamine 5'-phosphate oxidase family protein [unclassified Streptomyces]MCH0566256.1 pyridoxamine 5'-phosphate oxidase family protein [Streptomyces sp. MUM 2J]MCH0568423.1 pyridoxamine 5'-phosphate oxidase family protein [Streptomyces sp. MUM 136J]